MSSRPLLILDLDETLMHARAAPLDRPPDFQAGGYFGYKRPHLHELIEIAQRHFDLAVWTSASEDYAEAVIQAIFPPVALAFAWGRQRCTRCRDGETMEEIFVKDLAKVKRRGYARESVLAVDDSPEKPRRHYGNLVRVRPWEGEPTDDELRRLSEYLVELRGAANFRAIDKRGWNLRAAHPDASRLQEGDAYPSR